MKKGYAIRICASVPRGCLEITYELHTIRLVVRADSALSREGRLFLCEDIKRLTRHRASVTKDGKTLKCSWTVGRVFLDPFQQLSQIAFELMTSVGAVTTE